MAAFEWRSRSENESEQARGLRRRIEQVLHRAGYSIGEGALCDTPLRIFPWGFDDKHKELQFRQCYTMTVANNYKRPICCLAFLFAVIDVSMASDHLLKPDWSAFSLLALAFRCLVTFSITFLFSQRHLSHLAKRVWIFIFDYFTHIAPWLFIPTLCQEEAQVQVILVQTLIYAFAISFFQPTAWTISILYIQAVCFIPLVWNLWFIHRSTDFLLSWLMISGIASVLAPIFGAQVGVQRRREWALLRKKTAEVDAFVASRTQGKAPAAAASSSSSSFAKRTNHLSQAALPRIAEQGSSLKMRKAPL